MGVASEPDCLSGELSSEEAMFSKLLLESQRFTGKPYSSSIGLYCSYQRLYDPSIGRFISEDQLGGDLSNTQSHNPYTYVHPRPIIVT